MSRRMLVISLTAALASALLISGPNLTSAQSKPALLGGEDYATKVLGNPWDFEDEKDVRRTWNLTSIRYVGGAFSAVNTNNDPCLALNENGDIDADKYHILVFDFAYDGPFDLSDAGGCVARFTWKVRGSDAIQQTSDIITPAGRHLYVIDLKTYPLAPRRDSIGWKGIVNFVRFDPHEGWTPKRFYLYDMKLLSSDGASASPFLSSGTLEVTTDAHFVAPNKRASFTLTSYPEDTKKAQFFLDGRLKKTDRKPPFVARMKMKHGAHVVAVIALDGNGNELGRAEIRVVK